METCPCMCEKGDGLESLSNLDLIMLLNTFRQNTDIHRGIRLAILEELGKRPNGGSVNV